MRELKLHLGCGNVTPSDWLNVDYALGAQIMKLPFFSFFNSKLNFFELKWDKSIFIHDLRKKFPWKDESADIIYSSHTLEHLNKNEGIHFLNECYRVLKKNGILRIVVPDLNKLVVEYIEGQIFADDFVEILEVGYERSQCNFLKRKLAPFIVFPHKCMYDNESLIRRMSSIGFKSSKKEPFDSDIFDIKNVELPERTEKAVIVEGKKI